MDFLDDLIDAIQELDFADVEYFINQVADVNAVDPEGYSPLHHAAIDGDFSIINLLIQNGADINAETPEEDGYHTPLHLAILHANAERHYLNIIALRNHTDNLEILNGGSETPLEMLYSLMDEEDRNPEIDQKIAKVLQGKKAYSRGDEVVYEINYEGSDDGDDDEDGSFGSAITKFHNSNSSSNAGTVTASANQRSDSEDNGEPKKKKANMQNSGNDNSVYADDHKSPFDILASEKVVNTTFESSLLLEKAPVELIGGIELLEAVS